VLFQYPDNLFFGVSAAFHRPSPSRNGRYFKIEGNFGGKVRSRDGLRWHPGDAGDLSVWRGVELSCALPGFRDRAEYCLAGNHQYLSLHRGVSDETARGAGSRRNRAGEFSHAVVSCDVLADSGVSVQRSGVDGVRLSHRHLHGGGAASGNGDVRPRQADPQRRQPFAPTIPSHVLTRLVDNDETDDPR
jgi:hypothetical protein